MTRPNELWAVDFKEIWIHSEKAYALFYLDDFSRFLTGFALTQHPSAELAIETAREAIQRHGRPERILSDRGPQFHAWNGVSQFDEFLGEFLTDHTVTKAHHPFTNGKVEAFSRGLEAEVLDVEEFASLKEAEEKIRAHITTYNFFRTHMGIGGLVPADRPVVLDLRNLVWGSEEQAIAVADLFVEEGVLGGWSGRKAGSQTFAATAGSLAGRPPVIVIGPETEGVGEILAAALQRAGMPLVGGRTVGHAPHMQFVEEGDLTLWLPVGKWLRADGEPINGNGVEPDEAVEVDSEDSSGDPVLDRALELATQTLEQAA